MSFNLQAVLASKRALRRRLAELPIVQKLGLLDAMRERALVIRSATTCEPITVHEEPTRYSDRKGERP